MDSYIVKFCLINVPVQWKHKFLLVQGPLKLDLCSDCPLTSDRMTLALPTQGSSSNNKCNNRKTAAKTNKQTSKQIIFLLLLIILLLIINNNIIICDMAAQ